MDSQGSNIYNHDPDNYATTDFVASGTNYKTNHRLFVGKYTSYITDDITLTALFGKMNGTYYSDTPGLDRETPYLLHTELQRPADYATSPILNNQTVLNMDDLKHKSRNENLRLDLS